MQMQNYPIELLNGDIVLIHLSQGFLWQRRKKY
ncbi:hypothetical protein [Nostoc sp. T09]